MINQLAADLGEDLSEFISGPVAMICKGDLDSAGY
jgi:hypothetical protein